MFIETTPFIYLVRASGCPVRRLAAPPAELRLLPEQTCNAPARFAACPYSRTDGRGTPQSRTECADQATTPRSYEKAVPPGRDSSARLQYARARNRRAHAPAFRR